MHVAHWKSQGRCSHFSFQVSNKHQNSDLAYSSFLCYRHALEFAEREAEENFQRCHRYEIVKVSPRHIGQAVDQMFANPKVSTIRSAPFHEKLFLCSLVRQLDIDNTTECTFNVVRLVSLSNSHSHSPVCFIGQNFKTDWSTKINCFCFWTKVEERYRLICTQYNIPQLNQSQLLAVCANLGACKVLIVDPAQKGTRQQIRLAIERVSWINTTQRVGNCTIHSCCEPSVIKTGWPPICFENHRRWENSKGFG